MKNSSDSININTVYTTFDGEVNPFGIGVPTIFVRTQGCHVRCYLRTLGNLCDTPEALDMKKEGKLYSAKELSSKVLDITKKTGIKKVTLTGGDPLKANKGPLIDFLTHITENDIFVTIETSGTLYWAGYMLPKVSIIADYKLKSAGLKLPNILEGLDSGDIPSALREIDWLKFVVYDRTDYDEMIKVVTRLISFGLKARIAVGVYFNGPVSTFQLYDWLEKDAFLGYVTINLQSHALEKYRIEAENPKEKVGIDI